MEHIQKQYFLDELTSVPEFENIKIFYKDATHWKGVGEISISQAEDALLKKKNLIDYSRIKQTGQVLFKLNTSLVVSMTVKKSIRDTTLKNRHKILQKCFIAAEKSFFANHDPLTGLLNRNGAKNEYEKNLYLVINPIQAEEDESALTNSLPKLGLIAFDIDHFKQVNDSYSHDHGDVILKVFSARLNNSLGKLKAKFQCEFILSRPGGEEFELLVLGEVDKKIINEIANDVRNELLNPSLPTTEEFKQYAKDLSLNDIEEFKGHITASIGTSIKPKSNSNYQSVYPQLRGQADAALNRAKNDGRDCIRHYEDISRKHGKVYQHHEDSDLVIIDIGTKVGVTEGSRYKVFFPPFDGNKPIRKHDGRSEKKLGEYPRIDSGEIIVIQAQEQVSVCEIVSRINFGKFPELSSLEYVPIGNSARLIENPRGTPNWPSCGKTNDLIKSLNSKLQSESMSGLIAIALNSKRGTTEISSKFLVSLIQNLPAKSELYLINSNLIYALIPKIEKFKLAITKSFNNFNDSNSKWGAVSIETLPSTHTISSDSLIYYCSLALNYKRSGIQDENEITFFSTSVANSIIRSWMGLDSIPDAVTDYSLLTKYGVCNASTHNQLGLVLLNETSTNYAELAEQSFVKASQLDPTEKYFELNLGLSKIFLEKYNEAYEIYEKYKDDPLLIKSSGYSLAYGVSAVECYKSKLGVNLKKVRTIIKLALQDLPSSLSLRNQAWKAILQNFEM